MPQLNTKDPSRRPLRTSPLVLSLALLLGACSQPGGPATVPSAATPPAAGTDQSVRAPAPYDQGPRPWQASPSELAPQGGARLNAQALAGGDNFLSDQSWSYASNGWGPAERDRSNGETAAGDGRTITLNGVTYAKGLGVHANSEVRFPLNGACSSFSAKIGVDDEVGSRGSVVFQVWADGVKLYDSGVMTGSSATQSVDVNVTGRQELKLVVTDAGDNNYYDHVDWAEAKVSGCSNSASVAYQGPLVITRGGTYTGNYQSTDRNVPAISVRTNEPVIIENANLKGPGNLIQGWWMNITVRNTKGYSVNPNVSGVHKGRFISAEDVLNLRLENNYLEGTGGIYVNVFRGNPQQGQTIKILRNKVKNIDGRKSDGQGGYLNDRYYLQFVQFNSVRNVPGIEVAWNEVVNEPGQSSLEENINIYGSSGTASSPMKIHNNYIRGAYAIYPATDGAYSGGGILLGDGDISSMSVAPGYVDVYDNQILDTTNQGVGIAGGHDHRVYNNRILSSGRLSDGSPVKAQNVGVYLWDILGGSNYGTFFNNSIYNNTIGWTKVDSTGKAWLSNTWFANPCPADRCYNNASVGAPLSIGDIDREYTLWQSKLQNAGVRVGPQ